ncbi:serine/threonine protein kinase [Streptomyces pinistramenti]|uniref:serine/threonine protein kinase n=1 Tax=Streptomyces pinistramenti TaxID=2884812 RepID=UPI001D0640C2|nr:serine/threonine protein kinase [Streptomyces pinistramenti]MCB5908910.1 serine/threonine protein kinase [Streptomyces pinistramenti]
MEGLWQEDPSRIGEFVTLARLDGAAGAQVVPERRYVARSADGARTVLVSLPAAGADPGRWAVEAQGAGRLVQPGFWPVAQLGGTAAFPWHASPYRPVLPLPAALAAYGGPLPEDAVRAMGAALAETLASARVLGVVHGGVCPASVWLTAYGPLLTCFGAVRAAAPEGVPRAGLPGVDAGCLAPEQAAGGPVGAPGEVYALGAVLAYAATGHTVPERAEIPAGLRALVSACLSRDPAARPEPARVFAELAPGAAYGTQAAGAEPVALPGRVVAALSEQAAGVLAMELSAEVR